MMNLPNRLVDQDEDAATVALANLMRSHPDVMREVMTLFAPDAVQSRSEWIVSAQHRTHFGRKIDIFIRSATDDFAIVVEAKIRDSMKTYQFDAYVEHVVRFETGRRPALVWLVQRPRSVIGLNAAEARVVTWNDLHATLAKLSWPQIIQFCHDLVSCRIVLPHAVKTKRRTYKSCKAEHAVRILRSVRNSFEGLDGDVEEGARTPLGLHVGRTRWNLFWKRRVWLYVEPTTQRRDVAAPYGFVCHLLLYHAQDDTFEPRRIEQWSNTMAKLGLVFGRNVHGKWNRGCDAFAPIQLRFKVGVKLVGARRPVDMVRDFDWQDDVAAIADGCRYLAWGLGIIDECLREGSLNQT